MKVYIWLKKERKSGIEDLYSFDMYIFEAYEKNYLYGMTIGSKFHRNKSLQLLRH